MTERNAPCPFPIGAIYITTIPTNPTNTRPRTYRVPFGKWRTIVCVDDSSPTLKSPNVEFWSGVLAQQEISQGEDGSVKVTTSESNYQPSITAYIRKRVDKSEVQSYNPFNITDEQATQQQLYGDNVIIDPVTLKPKQPNPYSPI